jgi:hypothetical protein
MPRRDELGLISTLLVFKDFFIRLEVQRKDHPSKWRVEMSNSWRTEQGAHFQKVKKGDILELVVS